MIGVLIVDDHDIVREGVKQIVSETPDVKVRAEAKSGREALDLLRESRFDVVLLDLNLPDTSGLEVLRQIRAMSQPPPVLVLSMHEQPSYAARALRSGAAGYVTKNAARQHLVAAIRKLARGERFLPPDLAESLAFVALTPTEGSVHERLSEREFQVLCLIASGKPPREIASQLNVSVKTVATHRARLLEKMGLKNNAELVHYALEHHLLGKAQ